jgi:hypothetical protein
MWHIFLAYPVSFIFYINNFKYRLVATIQIILREDSNEMLKAGRVTVKFIVLSHLCSILIVNNKWKGTETSASLVLLLMSYLLTVQ